jgi:hypothetical protein
MVELHRSKCHDMHGCAILICPLFNHDNAAENHYKTSSSLGISDHNPIKYVGGSGAGDSEPRR